MYYRWRAAKSVNFMLKLSFYVTKILMWAIQNVHAGRWFPTPVKCAPPRYTPGYVPRQRWRDRYATDTTWNCNVSWMYFLLWDFVAFCIIKIPCSAFHFSTYAFKCYSSIFVCLLWISTCFSSDEVMLKVLSLLDSVCLIWAYIYSICEYSETLFTQSNVCTGHHSPVSVGFIRKAALLKTWQQHHLSPERSLCEWSIVQHIWVKMWKFLTAYFSRGL